MNMNRVVILLILYVTCVLTLMSQEVITGIVVDSKNNPIPGARVELDGRSEFAVTDIDGSFRIDCPVPVKKVKVSYVGYKPVSKKVVPDMVVKLGKGWRQAPDNYQWFLGGEVGPAIYDGEDTSFALSIMGGRVKKIGWYAKTSMGFPRHESRYNTVIAGGIGRLWCPLHFYLGAGWMNSRCRYGAYDFYTLHTEDAVAIDAGFIFRINNIGLNLGMYRGLGDNNCGSFSFGFSYFFK